MDIYLIAIKLPMAVLISCKTDLASKEIIIA